jgi:peptide deformylase
MKIENYEFKGEILPIVTYPDPVLSAVASPVTVFDEELEKLVRDMLFTMYHAPGIGLAAPQIGKSIRLFVMDVDYDREEVTNAAGKTEMRYTNLNPLVLINPVIKGSGDKILYEEGCLSVPGVYEEVKRFSHITVDYQDLQGNRLSMEAEELMAICLQHENDHLEGIVFIERLSNLKKQFYKKKLVKEKNG